MIGCLLLSAGRRRLRKDGAGTTQGRDHVRPEGLRAVVVAVQSDPGHRPVLRCRPQRQSHRFACPGGPCDHSQRVPPGTTGKQLGDPRARHGEARHIWHCDLGCQDRIGNGWPSGTGPRLSGHMGHHWNLAAPRYRPDGCPPLEITCQGRRPPCPAAAEISLAPSTERQSCALRIPRLV
jgi:hypothetical protein